MERKSASASGATFWIFPPFHWILSPNPPDLPGNREGKDALFQLDDRTAVVTGACGRLDPIWTGALFGAGGRVACMDLEGMSAPPAFGGLFATHGGHAALFGADVTDRGSLVRAARLIEARLGPVGILVDGGFTAW